MKDFDEKTCEGIFLENESIHMAGYHVTMFGKMLNAIEAEDMELAERLYAKAMYMVHIEDDEYEMFDKGYIPTGEDFEPTKK